MKSLFLVTEADVSSSIPIIQTARDKGDVVVIALDFWAKKRLRQSGIAYRTPDEYLDMSICKDIDFKAVEMAQTWYKPLGEKLIYRNIPLGQMAEYDFGFLFIDALRSIEIATNILSYETPNMVFLPQRVSLSEPNAMCYETLPKTLHYLARLNNIPVTMIKPGPKATFLSNIESLENRARVLVLDIARRAYNIYHSIPLHFESNRGNLSLFLTSRPLCSKIGAEMDEDKNLPLTIFPERVKAKETRRKAKEIRKLWAELEQDEESHRRLVYNNVPLLEVLDYRFQQFFLIRAPKLLGYIEWVDKVIHRLKPSILVVMEDITPVGRTIARTFKIHGLPVLVIQHGAVSVDMAGFHVMPVEAQKQAVWGDTCREWHIERGRPPESQIVTGNPRFDLIASDYLTDKNKICRKLNLDAKRGIIVVATGWFAGISAAATIEAEEQFIRSTLKALKNFPQQQIVLKLHPAYYKNYQRMVSAIAQEENIKVAITKDYLWELLAISDLAIVSNSTAGLEAMILDKPVVIVNSNDQLEKIPYVSSEGALSADEPEEIALAVKEILDNKQVQQNLAEARKKFIYEYAYIQDGKASKRIATLIMQMMQSNRKPRN